MSRFIKLLVVSLCFLMMACSSSCSYPSARWGGPDNEARRVQKVMKSAVFIKQDIVVDLGPVLGLDFSLPAQDAITGSGVIVKDYNGKFSLIVTAAHVCDPQDNDGEIEVLSSSMTVMDVHGDRFPAEVIAFEGGSDVCVVSVSADVGDSVKVAKRLPPIGAKVAYSGAPQGVWTCGVGFSEKCYEDYDIVPYFEGHFFGRILFDVSGFEESFNYIAIGIPAIGGASGSGIIYDGQLIGLVTRVNKNFKAIAYGPDVGHIRDIIEVAEKKIKGK